MRRLISPGPALWPPPAALPARPRRRPPVRAAVPPCRRAGTARPSPGPLARKFGAEGCSQRPVGRARAAPYSAPGWERPPSGVRPSARGRPLVLLWAVAAGVPSPRPLGGVQRRQPALGRAGRFARLGAGNPGPGAPALLTGRGSGKADALLLFSL